MPYIGKSPSFGVRNRFVYVASSGATSVSGADANGATLTFTDGAFVDVYLNGVLLKPTTDYNTSTANTIAGLSALNTSDEVTVVVYDVFAVADAVSASSGGTFGGDVVFSGNVSGLDVNGTEIILDADADTSITADTDDEIHFKVAGSDHVKIKGGTNVLHVIEGSSGQGTPHTNSGLVIESDGETGINILTGNTDFGGIVFGDDGDNDNGFIQYKHNDKYLRFGTDAAERVRFSSTGNITTNETNDIIKTDGHLKISNTFAFHGSTSDYGNVDGQNFHELNSGIGNEFILMLKNTNSGTTQHGLYFDHASGNTDNTSATFIQAVNTAARFKVLGDGDVQNHDNSYGSISDERIKQDITDAKSQWDDIKSIKIRNYKKKDDIRDYGDKAWSQIGVVAQELETVSPYLIKENSPSKSDILSSSEFGTLYTSDDAETKAVLYKDGDTIPEGKEVGDVKTPASKVVGDIKEEKTTVKSVKYSVLYMKAIKALQEAMERIETLEAKVKTLEEA